jgi:phage shock protein A
LAQRQHANLNKEHELIDASISQAMDKNRDDLAKTAIARQIDIEAQLPVLELNLADLGAQETELAGFVDALMGKKREMQAAIRDFEDSRKKTESASLREAGAYSTAGTKLEAAQTTFDRAYQRQTGLNVASRGSSIEQAVKLKELSDMVLENKINERLAALKTK